MSKTRVDAKGEREGGREGGGQWSRPRWRREVRQQQGNWGEKKSIVGLATNSFTFVLSSSFDFDVLAVLT